MLPAPFVAAFLAQVKAAGGLRWDTNPGRFPLTPSQRMAANALLERGELETGYNAAGDLVLRVPEPKEASVNAETPDRPYDITPAIEALRARRRALGR